MTSGVFEPCGDGFGEDAGAMATSASARFGATAPEWETGGNSSRAGNNDMAVNSSANTTPPPSMAVRVRRARSGTAVGESLPWTDVSGLPFGAIWSVRDMEGSICRRRQRPSLAKPPGLRLLTDYPERPPPGKRTTTQSGAIAGAKRVPPRPRDRKEGFRCTGPDLTAGPSGTDAQRAPRRNSTTSTVWNRISRSNNRLWFFT